MISCRIHRKLIDDLALNVSNLQCMRSPHGIVYMAAKKHYFGVGGGTRRFLSVVEKDGELI